MTRYGYSQLVTIAKEGGFTAAQAPLAAAIAMAESRGSTTATNHDSNGTTDYGLWQINSVHTDLFKGGTDWQNPVTNARMAHTVFKSQGWNAWTTYKNGTALSIFHGESATAKKGAAVSDTSSTNAENANFVGGLGGAAVGGIFGAPGAIIGGIAGSKDKNLIGGAASGAKGLADSAKAMGSFFSLILQWSFWERVLYGAAGVALIIIGIALMIDSNKTVRNLTAKGMEVAAA